VYGAPAVWLPPALRHIVSAIDVIFKVTKTLAPNKMDGRFTHKNLHGNKKNKKIQKGIVLNPRVPMRYSSSLGAQLVIRRVY
jgi:hypothetical protein